MFATRENEWVGIIIWVVCWAIGIVVSVQMAKKAGLTAHEFFSAIILCGIRKIAKHITLLSNPKKAEQGLRAWWHRPFEIWWGFSIKYLIPVCLVWLNIWALRTDIDNGGYNIDAYPMGTQSIGVIIVVVSLL